MTEQRPLPKVGDRVQIDGRGETYVVVEVNVETNSVSVLPESEVVTTPVAEIIPVAEGRSGGGNGSPADA